MKSDHSAVHGAFAPESVTLGSFGDFQDFQQPDRCTPLPLRPEPHISGGTGWEHVPR